MSDHRCLLVHFELLFFFLLVLCKQNVWWLSLGCFYEVWSFRERSRKRDGYRKGGKGWNVTWNEFLLIQKRLVSLTPQRILVALRTVYNPKRSVNTLQVIEAGFFLVEAENFSLLQNIWTPSRSYADSCPLGTAMFLLGVTHPKRVTLITHMHIILSVRMSGAINPLFLCDWMEWTETNVSYKCFLACGHGMCCCGHGMCCCGHGMCCRMITTQFPLYTLNNKLF